MVMLVGAIVDFRVARNATSEQVGANHQDPQCNKKGCMTRPTDKAALLRELARLQRGQGEIEGRPDKRQSTITMTLGLQDQSCNQPSKYNVDV
jgi:hypothetical protein